MMLRGEQTQNVLQGVEAKTKQLNERILPPDVKDPAVLRPQRPGSPDHRYRGAQPGSAAWRWC